MNNDRLKKWALISEIIGGIAVVVSLVFLILEIKHNTRESQLNTQAIEISVYNDLISNIMSINENIIEEGDFAEIVVKANNGDELSKVESLRYGSQLMNLLRHGDVAYFQYKKDAIDTDRLRSIIAIIRGKFKTNFAKEIWIKVMKGEAFDREYLNYLDKYFKEDAIKNPALFFEEIKKTPERAAKELMNNLKQLSD